MGWEHYGAIHATFDQDSLRRDGAHLYEEVDPYEVDPDVKIVLSESSRLQDSPEKWKIELILLI